MLNNTMNIRVFISSSSEEGLAINRRQLILYTSTAAIAASSTDSNALALNGD